MVAIRLARTGAKKKPTYRVIVTDKRRPRNSKTLEIVGHYNPRLEPIELNLKRDRIGYWLGVGAQPSDTVKRLIKFFDENGPTLAQPKRKAMQEAAGAAVPAAKPEEKKAAEPKAEEPKAEAKAEEPAAEAKAEEPKAEAKAEEPKAEAAAEEPTAEAKAEEPKAEEPAAVEEEKKPEAEG